MIALSGAVRVSPSETISFKPGLTLMDPLS